MMKNKLFNKNLYIEGLLQLKTIGIVTSVLSVVIACMTPLVYLMDDGVTKISIYAVNPFIYLITYIITPIMIFNLFSFLFRRNRSDFYHSIPQSRISLYFSFALSVISWVAFELILSMTTALTGAFLVDQYYIKDLAPILPMLLNLFSGALFIISASLIGISVSGRVFPAITVTGMILFYPRFCYTCYCMAIIGTISEIDGTHFLPSYVSNYNSFFFNYTKYSSFIYTTVISLILLIIGAILFKKRKSQTAEHSSSSNKAQTIIRVLISMAFCVPAVCILFSIVFGYLNFESITGYASEMTILVIILYIFASIVYFLYEVFSTKSTQSVLKAIKDIGYVVLANVLVFSILAGSAFIITSYSPELEKIESIEILEISDYENDSEGYENLFFSNDITDSLYNTFSEGYYKSGNSIFPEVPIEISGKAGIKTICDNYDSQKIYNDLIVKCKINQSSTKYRDIVLTRENIKSILKSIKLDRKELNSRISAIKNPYNIKLTDFTNNSVEGLFYDKTELQKKNALKNILNIALAELSTISDEDLAKIYIYMKYDGVFDTRYTDFPSAIFTLSFYENGNKICIPIYSGMSMTISAFLQTSNSETRNTAYKNFLTDLKNNNINDDYSFYVINSDYYLCYNFRIKRKNQSDLYNKLSTYKDVYTVQSSDDIILDITKATDNADETAYNLYLTIPKSDFDKYFSYDD